ncbi:hypothetical protein ACW4E8_27650, partial [Cupriavidus sp. CP313]
AAAPEASVTPLVKEALPEYPGKEAEMIIVESRGWKVVKGGYGRRTDKCCRLANVRCLLLKRRSSVRMDQQANDRHWPVADYRICRHRCPAIDSYGIDGPLTLRRDG